MKIIIGLILLLKNNKNKNNLFKKIGEINELIIIAGLLVLSFVFCIFYERNTINGNQIEIIKTNNQVVLSQVDNNKVDLGMKYHELQNEVTTRQSKNIQLIDNQNHNQIIPINQIKKITLIK